MSPEGFPSWKQVMRPFWLLAPKLPRKYPVTERSPNFGLGAGAKATPVSVSGERTGAACCSACFGSSVLWRGSASGGSWVGSSAKASVDRTPVTSNADNPNDRVARRKVDLSVVCGTGLLPVVRALSVLAFEVLAHEILWQSIGGGIEGPRDGRDLGELLEND